MASIPRPSMAFGPPSMPTPPVPTPPFSLPPKTWVVVSFTGTLVVAVIFCCVVLVMRLIAIYFPERGAYAPKDIEELRELEQERPFGRLHRRLSRRPRPASPPPTPTAEDLLAAASAACATASAAAEAVRAAIEGL
ncbi:hypothetical protein HFD88_008051 [Aspergillus terreus]|nr:hypothetical protein HFD88_008051 [Aspergillus terreus]